MNIEMAKRAAFEARDSYRRGLITREEARAEIQPFIKGFNEISVKKAREFGVRPKKINFNSFIR